MPPAVVLLALVGLGVPSALRAIVGRPRFVVAAILASLVATVAAQVGGDLLQLRLAVVGDAQVGLAALASLAASALVAIVEGPAPAAEPR